MTDKNFVLSIFPDAYCILREGSSSFSKKGVFIVYSKRYTPEEYKTIKVLGYSKRSNSDAWRSAGWFVRFMMLEQLEKS
jgi:hypothetical protein